MRTMIVGSDKVYAIENFYVRYLPENGLELALFPAQSFFYDYYQKNIVHKLLYKAGLSRILVSVNREFRQRVEAFRPDVIWVFKGMEIFPESLRWARERKIKLVNYNADNPFIFTGKGSGNSNVTESLPLYDLHLTYNLEIEKELREKHGLHAAMLPFGFDLDAQTLAESAAQPEVVKLCFLGNPDDQRAEFIRGLAAGGAVIDLYGNDWAKFVTHSNVTCLPPVYAKDFWRVLRRYRIQLNLMRVHNEDSHNMRSFEIPGVGGIMLAPDTTEHRAFFTGGKEAFFYKTPEDCLQSIDRLLRMDEGSAGKIRKEARRRSLESGYTYRDRARQAAGYLHELL